jgi:hypothetical protein
MFEESASVEAHACIAGACASHLLVGPVSVGTDICVCSACDAAWQLHYASHLPTHECIPDSVCLYETGKRAEVTIPCTNTCKYTHMRDARAPCKGESKSTPGMHGVGVCAIA